MSGSFGPWPEYIHDDPDQRKRMASATKSALTPVEIYEDGSAQFSGRSGKYITTLESCQCGDFISRRLPCKHMYRLAYELERFDLGGSVKTSKKAILQPDQEIVDQWFAYLQPYIETMPEDSCEGMCAILQIIRQSGRLALIDKVLEYIIENADLE